MVRLVFGKQGQFNKSHDTSSSNIKQPLYQIITAEPRALGLISKLNPFKRERKLYHKSGTSN